MTHLKTNRGQITSVVQELIRPLLNQLPDCSMASNLLIQNSSQLFACTKAFFIRNVIAYHAVAYKVRGRFSVLFYNIIQTLLLPIKSAEPFELFKNHPFAVHPSLQFCVCILVSMWPQYHLLRLFHRHIWLSS